MGRKCPILNTGNSLLNPFNNRHSNLTHRLSLANEKKKSPLLSRHQYIISKGYNDISSPRDRQKDGVAKARDGKNLLDHTDGLPGSQVLHRSNYVLFL